MTCSCKSEKGENFIVNNKFKVYFGRIKEYFLLKPYLNCLAKISIMMQNLIDFSIQVMLGS